jgi:hypothetical protein
VNPAHQFQHHRSLDAPDKHHTKPKIKFNYNTEVIPNKVIPYPPDFKILRYSRALVRVIVICCAYEQEGKIAQR